MTAGHLEVLPKRDVKRDPAQAEIIRCDREGCIDPVFILPADADDADGADGADDDSDDDDVTSATVVDRGDAPETVGETATGR